MVTLTEGRRLIKVSYDITFVGGLRGRYKAAFAMDAFGGFGG